VNLAVAGSNPVDHPIFFFVPLTHSLLTRCVPLTQCSVISPDLAPQNLMAQLWVPAYWKFERRNITSELHVNRTVEIVESRIPAGVTNVHRDGTDECHLPGRPDRGGSSCSGIIVEIRSTLCSPQNPELVPPRRHQAFALHTGARC
jgi:hypothetical protein